MATITNFELKIISFNMHGFHQGCPVLNDIIDHYSPDLILLQEHWLTPGNLYKSDVNFVDYLDSQRCQIALNLGC